MRKIQELQGCRKSISVDQASDILLSVCVGDKSGQELNMKVKGCSSPPPPSNKATLLAKKLWPH